MTKIGDIVTGYGKREKDMVHILVETVCPAGTHVSGKLIVNGRASRKYETIESTASWDVMQQGYRPAGWQPSDVKLKVSESMSGKIKSMTVGEIIDVPKDQMGIDTCRSVAARIAVNEGRAYTVNRTENGCKITRKE